MFNTTPLIKDSPESAKWIRVWDPRCLREHQRKVPHSMDYITVDRHWADRTLVTLWCMMSTLKKWQIWKLQL